MNQNDMKYVSIISCNTNHRALMEEFNKFKQEIKVELAGLPKKLLDEMDNRYVSKDSFSPIQKIVYGLVGAVLLGVVGAIMALIIK